MNKPGIHVRPDLLLMSDPCCVVLERWTTDLRKDALYLVGEIHGARALKDGTLYRTSPVKWIRGDLGLAETQDGVYVLRNRR
ncbi:MAG: hypothetical protein ACM3SS_00425 [Rhodospirillaceae bacterium]